MFAAVMSSRTHFSLIGALALALAALSCSQQSAPSNPPVPASTNSAPHAATGTNPTIYQVKGVIKELFPERKKVLIDHEDIPGYMEAMTMMLDVREDKELQGLQAGDSITFRMLVTEDDGWIDQLKKVDGPRTPLPSKPSGFRPVREVEPLAVGDKIPDYTFTNTLGRIVRLSDFKGQALGFTFIFTRCPFPTFCPRLSSNFEAAQEKLKAMSGGPTNWHLLSITIDPDYDTPERLKEYSAKYKVDLQHWNHVTAPLIDITAIGEQFGLQFWRANPAEPINHNVRTVVIDANGVVQWTTPETDFKVDSFVEQMVKAARVPMAK